MKFCLYCNKELPSDTVRYCSKKCHDEHKEYIKKHRPFRSRYLLDDLIEWLKLLWCILRRHHNWKRYCYGGLGGSYFVTKCSCCGMEKPHSFQPEMTL